MMRPPVTRTRSPQKSSQQSIFIGKSIEDQSYTSTYFRVRVASSNATHTDEKRH